MDATAQSRSYTDDQRAEALRLYRDVGAAEAGRRCEIPSATIRSWARRGGVSPERPASEQTRAATDAARRSWAQRRILRDLKKLVTPGRRPSSRHDADSTG